MILFFYSTLIDRPARTCKTFESFAMITGVISYVELEANLTAQLMEQELPAELKPLMLKVSLSISESDWN